MQDAYDEIDELRDKIRFATRRLEEARADSIAAYHSGDEIRIDMVAQRWDEAPETVTRAREAAKVRARLGCRGGAVIRLTQNGVRLILEAPFHPSLREKALALGGKWAFAARVWTFDAAHQRAVRDLCIELWGAYLPPPAEVTR